MVKNKNKIILLIVLFLSILIVPNYANAASVSVGKVKGVKVSSQSTTSIKISWNSVSKATGYRIYKYNSTTKEYDYYGKTTSKSITVKNLKSSQEYKFKIRAYRTVKGKNYYGSYSSVLKTATKPTQVKNVKVSSQTDSTIDLTWDKVTRASGYRVYIYNNTSKSYEYYGYSNTNSITIKNLKSSEVYKIKIRAYKNVDGTRYFGSYSLVLTTVTTPTQVKNVKASSQTDSTINLTWSGVTRASGYRVYIYNATSKSYEYYGYSNTNSITIKNLKSSEEYKIKIRAYKNVDGTRYFGSYSSILTTATTPTQVKNVKVSSQTDSTINLTWNGVTGATGYSIYVYNSDTNQCEYSNSLNTNSIIIKGLKSAQKYKIKVRAYKTSNKTNYYGSYSDTIDTFTIPSKITGLKAKENSLTGVKLSWNEISGASGYEISNDNTPLEDTTNNSYSITDLNSATGYQFKVRAYITINGTRYYGSYSDILETVTLPKVTGLKSTAQTENSITVEWNTVDEATGYAVYLYSDTTENFEIYKEISENNLEITELDTARFYKIYVKPYATINGKNYYSEESSTLSKRTISTDNIKAGIDVSEHQGTINWEKVKDEVDFAILRVGWIGNKENHTLDTKFEYNYSECKRLGIPVGVYVYCYSNCVKTAQSGANWVVKQLEGKTLEYPVFIDMEDSSIANIGKDNLSNICIEFNNIIAKAGFETGIYANKNWFTNYLNSDLITKYNSWIAHYTSKNQNYDEKYNMWQYSSKGKVNGVSGDVDLDIMYIK